MLLLALLALGVPTDGDFPSFTTVTMARGDEVPMPVYGTIAEVKVSGAFALRDAQGNEELINEASPLLSAHGLRAGDRAIFNISFNRAEKKYVAHEVVSVNPILTLPLIPGLEERARNLYFHVPSAWLAQLAWFIAFGYAILSLRKKRPEDDIRATAAAAVGAIFCILATVTGAVWAQFNWGVFWNWDPRQTAIFVVLIIYGAYFALRSAIPNEDQRARVSAVYLVLLALPVVFFLFVFPRLVNGLHPGSLDSGNAGPVLSGQDNTLNPVKQAIFALSMFSFTMLFFWILNVAVRVQLLDLRRRIRSIGRSEAQERRTSPAAAIDRGVVRLK
jgi:heme exporter protein C